MKLLRHLLSHLVLISFLFGLVSLYYYRYQLIPDTYTETMDAYTDKIHPSVKLFSRETKNTEDAQAVITTEKELLIATEVEKNTIAIDQIDPVDKIEKNPVVIDVPEIENKEDMLSTVMPEDNLLSSEPPVAVKNTQEKIELDNRTLDVDSEIVTEVTIVTEDKVDVSDADVTDRDSDSTQDLLRAARLAFNQGEIDLAIKKYKDLIELDNDEADFHGELGNVYYAKGDWANAGVEYYEAASRLIEKKRFAQVAYLQRVIQGLDAERAEKLASELSK